MAGSERSGIICIPFETGVTVDIEDTGNEIIGRVYTVSSVKPGFRDIDFMVSIGFPKTYDSWIAGKPKSYIDSNCSTEN